MINHKIINLAIVCIITFLAFANFVKADYKCSYDVTFAATSSVTNPEHASPEFSVKSDGTISWTWNLLGKTVWVIDDDLYKFVPEDSIDETFNFLSTAEYVEKLNGNCPKEIYMCNMGRPNLNGGGYTDVGLILNTELFSHIPSGNNSYITSYQEMNGIPIVLIGQKSQCAIGRYNSKRSERSAIDLGLKCNNYLSKVYGKTGLFNLYCDINDVDCTVERLNEYNEKRDELISWCRSMLQYADYIDPCVQACTTFPHDLALIEGEMLKGECGFSFQIIVWVNNIMKWIKYILPVLVVIFGIIDFIKAMSASNDDEMKKAQKHFVTRLIAAALTFVVPLIISFILTKMGFTPEACGIDVLK